MFFEFNILGLLIVFMLVIIQKYKSNKEEIPMNLTKLGFNLTFAKVK